ncbi:MAG: 1-acyl-sn-glycerol-3-phosphate acyltransferase [Candidatus Dormibacteraeota bacterium]|nr:1-acyl-sn-glycerol-3-phosphate acyltransferase [Candidatus Dormibacteraeota bacterium]
MPERPPIAPGPVPPADLLPVGRRANRFYRGLRLVAVPLAHLVFRFQVEGREHVPHGQAYIAIANHLAWMDWMALLIVLPVEPRVHFLADPAGLLRKPLEWWLVRRTGGYVPVDMGRHGDPRLYDHVLRCLALGGAVAIFPEGRYGPREGSVLPFKKGFAHFAVASGAPVVPVALSGTRDLWLRKTVRVLIGPAVDPAAHTAESLTATGRAEVERLLPAYVEPAGPRLLRKFLTGLFD